MKQSLVLSGIVLTVSMASAATTASAPPPTAAPTALASLSERVRPSVVEIIGTVAESGDTSYGSGFVLREATLVLTNAHVVRGVKDLRVHTFDGAVLASVEVLLCETDIDLAVLRVIGLKATPLAEAPRDLPVVGTRVVAVGHPRGYEFTVSDGIVSAHRTLDDGGPKMIQTTAPISPGSSGGPLLDLEGRVVGVCSLTLTEGQNINFAIPIAELPPVIDKALAIERALSRGNAEALPVDALASLVRKQREKGDLERAGDIAARALKKYPDSVPLLLEAAETAFARGSLQEVRRFVDAVDARKPSLPQSRQIRAALLAEQGDCNGAVSQAQAALAAPGLDAAQTAEAHAVLGECLGKQGKPLEALQHVDQALASPHIRKLPDYHALRAFLLQNAGKLDEADSAAVMALQQSQWDPLVEAALRERGLPRLVEIVAQKSVVERGETSVRGVVKNRGPVALEQIEVVAEGKDATGKVVATGSAFVIPKALVPGMTGSFKVTLQGLVEESQQIVVRVVDYKEPR